MSVSPAYHDSKDEQWDVAGVSDIALKMGGVAIFIKAEYCTGLQAASMPTKALLRNLVDRLLNYGWPLVSATSLDKLKLPGQENILDATEAVKAMEYLAGFFDRKAQFLREEQLDTNQEIELAKDLRFAARYTEALLASLPDQSIDVVSDAAVSTKTTTTEDPAAKNVYDEPDLDTKEQAFDVGEKQQSSAQHETAKHYASEPSGQLHAASKNLTFKGPYVVEKTTWRPSLSPVNEAPRTEESTSQEIIADYPTDKQNGSLDSSSNKTTLTNNHARPQVPAELQGRRLISRTWFEKDDRFADLLGKVGQWRDSSPDYHFTTIEGRNGFEDFVHHFCDAKPLGISALFVIKCEHPLDPNVVSCLDYDILRFVRLILWDWTNGYPERKAERESLKIVRAEIKARKKEIAKASVIEHDAVSLRPFEDRKQETTSQEPVSALTPLEGLASSSKTVESKERPFFDCLDGIDAVPEAEHGVQIPEWLKSSSDMPILEPPAIDSTSGPPRINAIIQPIERGSNHVKKKEKLPDLRGHLSADSDDFTTLLRRSKLAALGVDAKSTRAPQMRSKSEAEQIARLQGENYSLKKLVTALQEELESFRPLDELPKGARTDDSHAHPLQHLVGQREGTDSSSMQAEVDSSSDDYIDEDLSRHTRNDFMSFVEFLNTEPPPGLLRPPTRRDTRSDECSTTKRHLNGVMNKLRKPAPPSAHVPTRESSKGKGRAC